MRISNFRAAAACGLVICGTAASAVSILGSAQGFAVLGAAAVANTGASTINGDVGTGSAGSITGLESATLTGAARPGDAVASRALADVVAAFGALGALSPTTELTGFDLAMVGVLTPGVYRFASSAQLTGALVLDFAGNPAGAFVFQVGSTLITAAGSSVTVLNGGRSGGVFWRVGSSATLGTGTSFAGNILADQSITLNASANILCGRAIALAGAVTLDGNAVSSDCAGAGDLGSGRRDFGSAGFAASAVPEPAAWAMLIVGFALVGGAARRRPRLSPRA